MKTISKRQFENTGTIYLNNAISPHNIITLKEALSLPADTRLVVKYEGIGSIWYDYIKAKELKEAIKG
jgi:hypothetical protein